MEFALFAEKVNRWQCVMGFVGKNTVYSVEYSKAANNRYFLRITINKIVKKRVMVIMKNPSTTCDNMANGNNVKISSYRDFYKCHIDRTTGKVLRKLKSLYDEIVVLNLYSLYETKPSRLNNYYYHPFNKNPASFQRNNGSISSYLSAYYGDVICAWGRSNGINSQAYIKQVLYVNSLFQSNHTLLEYDIKTCSFIKRTNNLFPVHGLT